MKPLREAYTDKTETDPFGRDPSPASIPECVTKKIPDAGKKKDQDPRTPALFSEQIPKTTSVKADLDET